jgi:hypothetical protein
MKRLSVSRIGLILPVFLVVIGIGQAKAQTSPGDLGVGLILGEPTGLSAKYYLGGNNALDFGVAWSLGRHAHFHVHADYLRHNFTAIEVETGTLPFYYGIGARVLAGDDGAVGIRIPVGVSYYFQNDPLEIFFEVVPVLDLAPSTTFSGNGGLGVRYYFNRF